jgi:hypothetical protein
MNPLSILPLIRDALITKLSGNHRMGERLVPGPLGTFPFEPPRGSGNAKVLDDQVVGDVAEAAASYVTRACDELGIRLEQDRVIIKNVKK